MYSNGLAVCTLLLLLLSAGGAAAVDTGPAVDPFFAAAQLDVEGLPDAIFLAWEDAEGIRSGTLRLDDGSFDAFPTQPVEYVTNLGAGVGGPPEDRRAYIVWVNQQLELMLVVFDAGGALVSPPHAVSSSVQISPIRISGTDSGAVIGYSWDENLYWDPRALTVGLNGEVLDEHVAENVTVPEQTLGVGVAANAAGAYGVVYIVSDTHWARLRRYDANGPVDPAPVQILDNASADYIPYSALFAPSDTPPFLFLAWPFNSEDLSADLLFAHAPLSPGDVTVGPPLSELAPEFPGSATAVAGLAGSPELAVVLWQERELQDPHECGCDLPPPIRVEFRAQVVSAGISPDAVGGPISVHLWEDGDPIAPPVSEPRISASTRTPGEFTVLWADSLLRFETLTAPSPSDAPSASNPGAASIHPSFPNPFSPSTTVRYELSREGAVRLTILDIRGRKVRTLVKEQKEPGAHTVLWNGADERGSRVPAGVYFARLEFAGRTHTRRIVVAR